MTFGSGLGDALDEHPVRAFVERTWFRLDPGWVDLEADSLNYSDGGSTFTTASGTAVTIEISQGVPTALRSQIGELDLSLQWRRAGPVCPACGGSILPDFVGPDRSDEAPR